MEYHLSSEQILIKEAARNFAKQVLLPTVLERDEHQKFPKEEIKDPSRAWVYEHDGSA